MKYSQAIVVAVAGSAALVAAAPALRSDHVHKDTVATHHQQLTTEPVVPAAPRDLEEFFERSLDEESLLDARDEGLHHHRQQQSGPAPRDLEFDDELLTREFGFDDELATRDMQQLDARMFEFILRLFTRPSHHDHHDHPHGHGDHHKANHESHTPHPANKEAHPAGAPTPSPASAAKKEEASASAATPSAATHEPSPTPGAHHVPPAPAPPAQAPLSARFFSTFHKNLAEEYRKKAAVQDAKGGTTNPMAEPMMTRRSFVGEEALFGRHIEDLEARLTSHIKAAWRTLRHPESSVSSSSVSPSSYTDPSAVPPVRRRSYDEEALMVRDFLDALEAVKRTYDPSVLDARSFEGSTLDELD